MAKKDGKNEYKDASKVLWEQNRICGARDPKKRPVLKKIFWCVSLRKQKDEEGKNGKRWYEM